MQKCLLTFFSILCLTACSTTIPVTKTNPTAANYNVELGLSYLAQGNVDRAKYKLLLAQQQAPNNPIVNDAMGYFLERTGETNQAQKYYLQAIKLAPKSGEAQNNYGTFLCRHGQYQTAISHFLLATQDSNYLHPAQVYENAGLCALKIPDSMVAESFFAKAIAHDPQRPAAILELAELNYKQHNYQEASSYLIRYQQMAKATARSQRLTQQTAAKLKGGKGL